MILAIEIGGTKLQLAVGSGDGSAFVAHERRDVDVAAGAKGILVTVATIGQELIARHNVERIGVGFGGPVDSSSGVVVKSHQVSGWDNFPLAEWLSKKLDVPARIENDANLAALAEARFGAGQDCDPVLYVTVGSGVGGGLIHGGQIYAGHGHAACEIGHLRLGLNADSPDQTVESVSSGFGIAETVRHRLSSGNIFRLSGGFGKAPSSPEVVRQQLIDAEESEEADAADLLERCGGDLTKINARDVAHAAAGGNAIAEDVIRRAVEALGWGIAQAVTLFAPQVVVIGGGVSLSRENLFIAPLWAAVRRFVFPPLSDGWEIRPAKLGEDVVLHGAAALARAKS